MSVDVKTLQIGESFLFEFETGSVTTAFSSSSPVASVDVAGGRAQVTANDLGEATLSIFSTDGRTQVIRVKVETPGSNIPPAFLNSPMVYTPGFRAQVGTQLGFRSTNGWFETLVRQEEFLNVTAPTDSGEHEAYVESLKPIQQTGPKSSRYLERIRYHYRSQKGWGVSLGDTDLYWNASQSGGPIRGLRLDYEGEGHQPFLVAGIQTTGVADVLTGSFSSPVLGAGYRLKWGRWVGEFRAIGFRQNPRLQILEDGVEAELGLAWHQDWIRHLELRVLADKRGKLAWEGTASLDLFPWAITLSGGRSESDMAVMTLPNRFDSSFDSYSLAFTYEPNFPPLSIGLNTSRTLSFLRQDQFEGSSVTENSGAVITLRPYTDLNFTLNGNWFESEFTPFSLGTRNTERGWRADWQTEVKLQDEDWLTADLSGSQVISTQVNVNYENQQAALGWKRYFLDRQNYLHLDLGITRFRFPADPFSDGFFLLGRVRGQKGWDWGGLEGRVQYEKRVSGRRDNDTLRAQLGVSARLLTGHELRLAVFRDFEWLRSLYRQTRGFFLRYTVQFGAFREQSSLASSLYRGEVRGRVFEESATGAVGSGVAQPLSGARISLQGLGGTQWTQTDTEGRYQFDGLETGRYEVGLDTDSVQSEGRLVSVSKKTVDIPGMSHVDFIYSKRAEVNAVVFNDLNYDGKFQEGEPPLASGKVFWKETPSSPTQKHTSQLLQGRGEFLNGRHRMIGIPSGEIEVGIDPFSLPSGYLPGMAQSITLMPRENREIFFPVTAQRSLSGRVYRDRNRNGKWDEGEGLSRKTVRWGKAATQTDTQGRYLLKNLQSGNHRVESAGGSSQQVKIGETPTQMIHIDVRLL